MIKALYSRLHQGYKTSTFPAEDPHLPKRYPGAPSLSAAQCTGCGECETICPTNAISIQNEMPGSTEKHLVLDLGRCIFCRKCELACPRGAIAFTGSFRMGARTKAGLFLSVPIRDVGIQKSYDDADNRASIQDEASLIEALNRKMLKVFGHALKIREVSAGGCNACEADINVLETIGFDLSRFGISITASPRHADAIIVTGPVSKNMELALKKTYEAMPSPKLVIAVGACAISGGIYRGLPDVCGGVDAVIPVDLYIPGCPPHPMTILNALLELLDRVPKKS